MCRINAAMYVWNSVRWIVLWINIESLECWMFVIGQARSSQSPRLRFYLKFRNLAGDQKKDSVKRFKKIQRERGKENPADNFNDECAGRHKTKRSLSFCLSAPIPFRFLHSRVSIIVVKDIYIYAHTHFRWKWIKEGSFDDSSPNRNGQSAPEPCA